jgi:hypothetical protein
VAKSVKKGCMHNKQQGRYGFQKPINKAELP